MDMDIEEEKKRILRVLADDWDKNPSNRANGIHITRLGALVGAYLNNPIYSVAELRDEGLVSKISNRVILTDNGYSSIRRHSYSRTAALGGASWFNINNPWIYIVLTIIAGVIVGLVLLFFK